MIKDLIIKNRSYRRFFQEVAVSRQTLEELVDLARLSASTSNLQPVKYYLSCEPEKNALIFPNLAWAGYLKDWPGPGEGEKPSAYIVMLEDTEVTDSNKAMPDHFWGCNLGIAAQSILLGAAEKGLGGCIIATIKSENLQQALDISPRYKIRLVLALGKPKEKIIIETVDADADIKYWRDAIGIHHVPKRSLNDIIVGQQK